MAASAEHIARLIYRPISGAAGEIPSAELAAWMEADPRNAALVNRITSDAGFRTAFEARSPTALHLLDQD